MQNGRIVMPPSEYTATTQSSAQSGLATLTTKIPGGNALELLGKVRAVVSAVLCATCSFIFVLMIHPDSSTDWDAPTIIVWTVALFCAVGIGDLVPHRVAILAQPGTLVDTASHRVPPGRTSFGTCRYFRRDSRYRADEINSTKMNGCFVEESRTSEIEHPR
jgi:hypothetical protein